MKKLIVACSLLLSSLAQAAGFDHSVWDGLLKKNVVSLRQGQATQVNYAAMASERAKLKAYLAATAAVPKASFDAWTRYYRPDENTAKHKTRPYFQILPGASQSNWRF